MVVGDEERTEEVNDDRPDIEEVVTRLGDVRVRSGFIVEELETGVLGISVFGPIFSFPDRISNRTTRENKSDRATHAMNKKSISTSITGSSDDVRFRDFRYRHCLLSGA